MLPILPTPTQPNLPRSDGGLADFVTSYTTFFQDVTYKQPVGTRATIVLAGTVFRNELNRVNRPTDRDKVQIQLKNQARKVLIKLLRTSMRLNLINYKNGQITRVQLQTVNQAPPKLTITPEPVPKFAPGLLLVSQSVHTLTLQLVQRTNRGSNTNTRLPVGVQNVQLLQKTINNGLHLIRSFTKPVVRVPLEHFPPGSDIVIAARYLGVRSEPGPISQSLTIHIPASPVVPS